MRTILLSLIISLLIGCAGTESSSHRRGKLSDAVDAASDTNTGDRNVKAEYRPPVETTDGSPFQIAGFAESERSEPIMSRADNSKALPDSFVVPSDTVQADSGESDIKFTSSTRNEEQEQLYGLGMNAGAGLLSSNDFSGTATVGMNLSTILEQDILAEFGAQMSFASLQRIGRLSHSIDDGVLLLGVNAQIIFPITPKHTFIGQYLFLGGGTEIMFWNYKNPITAPVYSSGGVLSGQETITSDSMNGIDLFTGIGFDLTQTTPVHLIVEVRPGVIVWTGTTTEGFDNDLFANAAYLQLRVKVRFSIQ